MEETNNTRHEFFDVREVKNRVQARDNGEVIHTISLGGLGPGYE